mmetsp:Transcript_8818/g.10094  ORF Transcript_8818/g.10094 Transcript_8818/m.10094 type:complete len:350 (+) Transcript_8818:100-1149(+)
MSSGLTSWNLLSGVEFLCLGLFGFFTTLYVGNTEFSWLRGGDLVLSPFQFGEFVMSHLTASEPSIVVYRNVVLLSLSMFGCLYLELNRKVLSRANPLVVILFPVLCFTIGPSTTIPFVAYYCCQSYERLNVAEFGDPRKTNEVKFERSFFVTAANLVFVVFGLYLIPSYSQRYGPIAVVTREYTDVLVCVPFAFSLLTAVDILVISRRDRNLPTADPNLDVPPEVISHYLSMCLYAINALIGVVLHIHSAIILLSYDSFWEFGARAALNPTASLFILNYAIVFSTIYLWLDGFSTMLLGPKYYKDGILSWKDLLPVILLGPTFHFNVALLTRENALLDIDSAKRRARQD